MPNCCIHLCDWSFCLYLHISYTCFFVTSYLFLLWYDRSLWHCFMLLFEEIQFLSQIFPFLATSNFSCVRCQLLLKTSIELFLFSFLFSGYFHSVVLHVVCIVFGSCKQSFSTLFYVVFKSLYLALNEDVLINVG